MLGIDPGTNATGWGVVECSGASLQRIDSGVLRLRGERAEKLGKIFDKIRDLCAAFAPDALSLEQSFVGSNVQTALRLGEARGSVMVAAAGAGVIVHEHAPASIKIAVAGSGRADKRQMQLMVGRLLGIDGSLASDEADALGAAICDLSTTRFDAEVARAAASPPATRRRRIAIGRGAGRR